MRRIAIVACLLVACGCGIMKRGGDDLEAEAAPVEEKREGALATKPEMPAATPAPASGPPALAPAAGAPANGFDTHSIEEAVGLTGATMPDGVFRITKPRGDLKVALDGFAITPRMGLAGWVAFRAHPSGAYLLGVMPVASDELAGVVSALVNAGLEPAALHPHFVGEEPRIAFVHFRGLGNVVALARGVRDVLDAIVRARAARTLPARSTEMRSELDPQKLDALLRLHGEFDGQVHRVAATRPDLQLRDGEIDLSGTLAPASWAAFQGSAERAAVAGEIMVTPSELQPVLHALREARLAVVGIHDDGLRGEPRISFVAFWGVGRAEALATGVRRGLDQLVTPGG